VHPTPLYKGGGGPRRRDPQHIPRALLHGLLPPPPWCIGPCFGHRHLPLSLPRGLPKGCAGDGNHHRKMLSCCGVSGSLFQSLYFHISAGNRVLGVIVVVVRVRVREGAARAVPESLCQDLHDLEVRYVIFDSKACARA
jgi:hypothetical protein